MRRWFTQETCPALTNEDRSILNRAARHLADNGHLMTHRMLVEVRMTYRPGMSAQNIINHITDEVESRRIRGG